MKKTVSLLLSILLIFSVVPLSAITASAATSGNYTYEVSNRQAIITYVNTSISGDITIPSTLGGYPVMGIYKGAFRDCSSLTSVTIPNSVISIEGAFLGCRSLVSINVYSDNQNFTSLDGVLFDKNKTKLICCPACQIGEYIIPDSVTSIGYYAFYGCSSLTSVTIPNSVTNINDYAFYDCNSLTSVTIPDSVKSIGDYAFQRCYGLISVTIPNSVTSIGRYAFSGCSSLTSVTIPNSVTSIGNAAFENCNSLTSVTIPNSVTSIDGSAFEHCSNLTSVSIPNSVTSIGNAAFENCSSLTSVTIPDSVTSIDEHAFRYCSSLTSITIVNGVTSIGNGAFSGCSSLTSVTIPNSVTSIGNAAFCGGSSLTSVTIGNGVTSIGKYAFEGCNLTSITIPDSVTNIGDAAFSGCNSLTSITIPFVGHSKDSISDSHFGYIFGASSYDYNSSSVPESLNTVKITGGTSINKNAFYGCSALTSVTIPDSVTSIGDGAFSDCSSLIEINVNSENQSYSSQDGVLFNKNKTELICCPVCKIGKYIIPDSVTSICERAFSGCSSLTSVTIPNSVTSIGRGAFCYCNNLQKITLPFVGASLNGTTNTYFGYIFESYNCYNNDCVPTSLKTVIITGGNFIDSYAFDNCFNLKEVIITDGVKTIDNNAFSWCTNLETVFLPKSIRSISWDVFEKCNLLTIYCIEGSYAESYADGSICDFQTVCGYVNGEIIKSHTYSNTCDKTCNICGATRTVSGHKYSNACDETCNICGAKRTVSHTYKTTTAKAILTKNGSIIKKCSVCGKVASTTTIYYPKTVSIAATTYTYTGKVITPAITVKGSNGKALRNGTDYTVSYASGRKNVGKYKVTVTFKGNYSGTKTFYFTINPVKTTVSKLTAGKKSIKVAISKKSTQVTGYQIQYATSKTFKSAKTATVKSYKTTSVNLTKLSAKKTYYVRVRTYKTVGKTTYYSGWSTYKYTKTK